MSATDRTRATARRLLDRFGRDMTFRLWPAVRDVRSGSQGRAPEPATTATARAYLGDPEVGATRGLQVGDRALLVVSEPFLPHGGLSDRWTVDHGDGERAISLPVGAAATEPGGAAYYSAVVKSGGGAIG
jgi:hypothetical protein